MSSCPAEFAAQVDAVLHGPFFSKDAPPGIWFKNNQDNICLTLPDDSYYYFNTNHDWYFKKREANKSDENCASVYVSPPGFRYDNPSSNDRRAGSTFVGVHWRTAAEKICSYDEFGMIYLTFRKLIDPTDLPNLPRKNIAVFTNQAGTQRVVEVNMRGIYTGNTPWMLEEIEFWHANLVPIGDVDGPEWRGLQQRLTPPAEGLASRASSVFDGRSSQSSSPSIKGEEPEEEMSIYEVEQDVPMGQNEQNVAHEEQNTEDEDMESDQDTNNSYNRRETLDGLDDTPVASGSGRACMRDLLAARRPRATPVVQGARVNKNVKAKPSQFISVQRNGITGFGFKKGSLKGSN